MGADATAASGHDVQVVSALMAVPGRAPLAVVVVGLLGLAVPAASEEWRSLFDGQDLDGWVAASEVDWTVRDGAVTATDGVTGLLHTEETFGDFELRLEYRAGPETNSGVFLRSAPRPTDPTLDCLELNIAPASHPFPTGSLVARARAEAVPYEPGWHRLELRAMGSRIEVRIDGRAVLDFDAAHRPADGVLGLQFNRGEIAFRDIWVRRLD